MHAFCVCLSFAVQNYGEQQSCCTLCRLQCRLAVRMQRLAVPLGSELHSCLLSFCTVPTLWWMAAEKETSAALQSVSQAHLPRCLSCNRALYLLLMRDCAQHQGSCTPLCWGNSCAHTAAGGLYDAGYDCFTSVLARKCRNCAWAWGLGAAQCWSVRDCSWLHIGDDELAVWCRCKCNARIAPCKRALRVIPAVVPSTLYHQHDL